MKNVLKKSLVLIAMLISIFSLPGIAILTPAYADSRTFGSCDKTLGMTPWDCGVKENPQNETELKDNIKQIISNISTDIAAIAAYLVIGYTIYGGYLYIFASGDTGKVAAGKKTLTHAFIGLAIVGLVNVILNSIHIALLGNAGAFDNEMGIATSAEELVGRLIQWFIGIAGVVSAVFVLIGGIGYMTSAGDSAKLQKAKNTILYALLGLAIVGISQAVVALVANIINNANTDGSIENSIPIILNSIIGVLSIVAIIFVIIGGYRYITSTGDAGKLQKAKATILYACIGLAVCALAFAIVNLATRTVNDSTAKSNIIVANCSETPIAFLEKKL